jgi:hypothetical protein
MTHGQGDKSYHGGGVLGRYYLTQGALSALYFEASARYLWLLPNVRKILDYTSPFAGWIVLNGCLLHDVLPVGVFAKNDVMPAAYLPGSESPPPRPPLVRKAIR